MNTIKLQRLSLFNFKGIRNLIIDDFGQVTNIYGANGSGKTTVFDAFTWLLFGKDSHGNTQFEIKTLDANNNVIPQIDHEVEATLLINNQEINLKRVLREKWVKRRGSTEAEFSGNETVYYWNDVPVMAKEFTAKVAEIMNEEIFKLITNPLAFNSLDWKKQREILISMVGGLTNEEVAKGDTDLELLVSQLTNKSLEEYKKQVAAQRKKANNELKLIPSRIDEVQRSKPTPVDAPRIEKRIKELESAIFQIDEQLQDQSKAHEGLLKKKEAHQNKIYALRSEIKEIEYKATTEAKSIISDETSGISKLKSNLQKLEADRDEYANAISTLTAKVNSKIEEKEQVSKQIDKLRKEWDDVNSQELTFNDEDFHCPTCKREFEEGDVEAKKAEMLDNFKKEKVQRLQNINTTGKANAEFLQSLDIEIASLKERLAKGEQKLMEVEASINYLNNQIVEESSNANKLTQEEVFNQIISQNDEFKSKSKELEELQNVTFDDVQIDNSELLEQKKSIQIEIKELESKLSDNKTIERANKRIEELEDEQQTLAQIVADQEKIEHDIERFTKLKIETLESKINEKFQLVRFKMFETQINGGESETCKALIDGVPFSDANTASKINAGIDIINTLCEFHKVNAPIFIDNRESVTALLPTDSQVINLYVSEMDAELRVESKQEELINA